MSHKISLPHHEEIFQYLKEQRFDLYFSKPVLKHMVSFIDAVTQKGFSGTLTDVHSLSYETRHRTTLNHFLQYGKWDMELLLKQQQKQTLKQIQQKAKRTGSPIFVIVDDSICEKKRPSSQAVSPIQGAYFSFSHKDKKQVWGHQVVVMLLQCDDLTLPYAFCLYDKKKQSKIEWVCDLLETLPVFQRPSYLLVDTWYNSRKIIDASFRKGIYLIGGLKANRILFPQGIYTQAKHFASMVTGADTHLVTIGEASYHVYRYEGACRGLDDVVVLLCWPEGQLGNASALRCFLSMDSDLSDHMILSIYGKRWFIEVFFQFMKEKFSFGRYRIRSTFSIERFWALLFLTYRYILRVDSVNICFGLQKIRKDRMKHIVSWIYLQTHLGMSLKQIQDKLNVA